MTIDAARLTGLPSIVVALALAGAPAHASAQSRDARPQSRVDVVVGGGLLAGAGLGSKDATLRANSTTPQPYRLFTAVSRFSAAPLFEIRSSVPLNRRLEIEGGLVLTHPELRSAIGNDVENPAALTIVERVDQYFIDARLIVMIDELSLGDRTVPFVEGGGGYLRQLHEGQAVVEHGHLYHLGAGLKHWMVARDRGAIKGAGVRGDARVYVMARGISFGNRPRPRAAISGSFFVSF